MLYRLLGSLLQSKRPWGEISIDFVTGLLPYKNLARGLDFDIILVIVNQYLKMAKYIIYYKIVDSLELVKIMWEHVFSLFNLFNKIVSNYKTVFTSQFQSTFYYYLICKQCLSTVFYLQIDKQIKRQNQALEYYLRSYYNL